MTEQTYQKDQNEQKEKRTYGLLGKTLKHSFSPQLHAAIGALLKEPYPYVLFEKQPEELEAFLRGDSWAGLNVTIPYKEAVIPYCDELSEEAAAIGAVNTIIRDGEHMIGHNTDYAGFRSLLCKNEVPVRGANCLVLGSGGASKTVQCVLRDLGAAKVTVVSRSGAVNYENVSQQQDAEILVNTTPIGMYPNNGSSPLYPGSFADLKWVVDVIYNPLRTNLLCQANKALMETAGGLGMLVGQGIAAAEYFLGRKIPDTVGQQIESDLMQEKQNVVLIGMPGVGKTTVGAAIASMMGRELYDIDEMIVYEDGREIPQIFAEEGEEYFRQLEQKVVLSLANVTGAVIACGGGVVTREENYYALAENGRLFFLNRNLAMLPTDGRPISQAVPLARLYQVRLPLYRSWCDAELTITGMSPEEAARHIIDML